MPKEHHLYGAIPLLFVDSRLMTAHLCCHLLISELTVHKRSYQISLRLVPPFDKLMNFPTSTRLLCFLELLWGCCIFCIMSIQKCRLSGQLQKENSSFACTHVELIHGLFVLTAGSGLLHCLAGNSPAPIIAS